MCYSVFDLVSQTTQIPAGCPSQYVGDPASSTTQSSAQSPGGYPPSVSSGNYDLPCYSVDPSSGYSSGSPTSEDFDITVSPEVFSEAISPYSLPGDNFNLTKEDLGGLDCYLNDNNHGAFNMQQTPKAPFMDQYCMQKFLDPYNGYFNFPQTTEGMAGKLGNNSLQHTLCKVCGDTASGNHFGVLSCEACKSFFRRSIRSSAHYSCRGTRGCAIEKNTRNRCQYCRLQKCMAIGMRKEGNVVMITLVFPI